MTHLISIDPSITCTGVAEFDDGEPVAAHRIVPSDSLGTIAKIDWTIAQIELIVPRFSICDFVIEITSGKTSSRHKGGGAGLGTYGMAVGHIARHLILTQHEGRVTQVYENDWTRGRGSKDKRIAHLKYTCPLYARQYAHMDPGGDIADAIGLGEWHMMNTRLEATA